MYFTALNGSVSEQQKPSSDYADTQFDLSVCCLRFHRNYLLGRRDSISCILYKRIEYLTALRLLNKRQIIINKCIMAVMLTLTLSTLGINFSRRHTEIFVLFFSQKTGLYISSKLYPMETICMKRPILFSGKIRNLSSAELAQRVVKVKLYYIHGNKR